jgi:hypothetical protein
MANIIRKGINLLDRESGNGKRVAKALEERAAGKVAKEAEGAGWDPFGVVGKKPIVDQPPSSLIMPPKPGFDPSPGTMQERSGVFDYDYKMPHRDSGVQRYQPKGGVPQRSQDLLTRPDVYDKMVEGTQKGIDMAGGQDWYETGPLFKDFIDRFGPEVGQKRFDAFMAAVASTSPRSDVGANVRNASFYYGKANPPLRPGQNSRPGLEDLYEKNPYPYGHLAQNLHKGNIEKTLYTGEGFDPRKNPKPLSFMWNLMGDPNLVTVDTHAFRAPAMLGKDPNFLETSFINKKGMQPQNIQQEYLSGNRNMDDLSKWGAGWQSKPRENEYGYWEDYYKRIANDLGVSPRQAQGGAWIGHGDMTGLESAPKPFMDFIEERILKTAKERNMDPKDVWRQAITGERPLTKKDENLNLPGASAVG